MGETKGEEKRGETTTHTQVKRRELQQQTAPGYGERRLCIPLPLYSRIGRLYSEIAMVLLE